MGIERIKSIVAGSVWGLAVLGAWIPWTAFAEIDDRIRTALEALSRLTDSNLEANPALKQAVFRILEQVRGEPEFVEVVRDFRLPGYENDLVEVAIRHSQAPQAIEAMRFVLASTNSAILKQSLQGESTKVVVELLGATGDSRAVPWLQPLLTNSQTTIEVRQAAVRSLTKTSEGSQVVLAVAKEGKLPAELGSVAGSELRTSRWPEHRAAANALFPAEPTKGGPLPPVAELLKMSGDPKRGAEVFRRPAVACNTCHQVHGEGTDFGPKLSEIGSKLGPDALIASILDPNSGISFGFEAWRVELKNGDEMLGMVVSETEATLSLKQQGGQVIDVKKSDVAHREKQTQSIMPAGLEQSLTPQEFVDLIAYLSSLRKVEP